MKRTDGMLLRKTVLFVVVTMPLWVTGCATVPTHQHNAYTSNPKEICVHFVSGGSYLGGRMADAMTRAVIGAATAKGWHVTEADYVISKDYDISEGKPIIELKDNMAPTREIRIRLTPYNRIHKKRDTGADVSFGHAYLKGELLDHRLNKVISKPFNFDASRQRQLPDSTLYQRKYTPVVNGYYDIAETEDEFLYRIITDFSSYIPSPE